MADGTTPTPTLAAPAAPTPVPGQAPPPLPNDGGPQPPNSPVQPGSGQPTNDPATNPSAPINAPTREIEDPSIAEARAVMADGSPDSFLASFLADNGLSITDQPLLPQAAGSGAQAPGQPPQGQQPQVQPPGNGVPPPPNGTSAPPPQQGQVDPALVQRLWQGPAAGVFQPGIAPGQPPAPPQFPVAQPQPAWPQPQQYAQPPQQQPAAAPSGDPNAPVILFNEPFVLPDQIKSALDHEDSNVRATAIGAAMAAAANTTAQRVIAYVRQQDLPRVAQATLGQFQQVQFRQSVDRDLFGQFPHLRFASPQLIQQAANIIVQDELGRNPGATVTPQVWQRIGQLASEGLRQMAGGQMPYQPPQPAPQAPAQPAYYPQQQFAQPVWDGQQWTYPQALPVVQPPAGYPAAPGPPPQPYVAGMSAAPFGAPTAGLATPESEFASFMQGGWGN